MKLLLTGAGSWFVSSIVAVVLAVAPAIHGQAQRSLLVLAGAAELGYVATVGVGGCRRQRRRQHRAAERDAHCNPPHHFDSDF